MIEWPLVDEDISKAKTLPGFMYSDTEVYTQSLSKVFAPSWQLIPAQYQIKEDDSGVAPFVLLPDSLAEHLLLVKDTQGNFANCEGLLHAGAAGIELATKEVVDQSAGFFVLGKNLTEKALAKCFIGAKIGILFHRFRVCGSERGFDVGEDVAEEIKIRQVILNVLIGFVTDRFES